MAERTRGEAPRRRASARDRRRSLASEPFEALDAAADGADGNGPDPMTATKNAMRTAAAAAVVGGLTGAAKVLLERRGRTHDEPEADDEEQRERGGEDSPDRSGHARDEEGNGDSAADEAERADDEDADEAEHADGEDAESEPDTADPPQLVAEQQEPGARSDDDVPQRGASSSDAAAIVERARGHVSDLLGKEVEGVSGISRANGAWSVTVEVVDLRRIPDSTDVLSSYEVALDDDGNLLHVERRGRYRRSQVEEDR